MTYFSAFLIQVTLLTLLYGLFHTKLVDRWLRSNRRFWFVVALVAAAQLATSALLTEQVGDVMLFQGVGYYYRYHTDFYFIDANHTQYPFFPFLIFLHAGLDFLVRHLGEFTFSFYLKVCALPALIALAYRLTKQKKAMLQLLTHPIVTMVVFFHGQVDVFLLFFLVWGWWLLFDQKRTDVKLWFLGALSIALSVACKTWSLLALPLAMLLHPKWWQRFALPVVVIGVLGSIIFVYTRTVFGSGFAVVLPAVLKAGGPTGIWGVTQVLPPLQNAPEQALQLGYFGILGLVTLLVWRRRVKPWKVLLLVVMAAVIVAPHFGIQYLFWFLPLVFAAKLEHSREFLGFTIIGSVYMFASYLNTSVALPTVPQPVMWWLSLLTWLWLVLWWLRLVRCSHLLRFAVK